MSTSTAERTPALSPLCLRASSLLNALSLHLVYGSLGAQALPRHTVGQHPRAVGLTSPCRGPPGSTCRWSAPERCACWHAHFSGGPGRPLRSTSLLPGAQRNPEKACASSRSAEPAFTLRIWPWGCLGIPQSGFSLCPGSRWPWPPTSSFLWATASWV